MESSLKNDVVIIEDIDNDIEIGWLVIYEIMVQGYLVRGYIVRYIIIVGV